jgi:hypothetical protein
MLIERPSNRDPLKLRQERHIRQRPITHREMPLLTELEPLGKP